MARLASVFLLAVALAACPPRGPALPALRSLSVSPQGAHLQPGQQLQLFATATYADDSHRDVTATARWAAPADAGLGVAADGRASARSPGPVAVEATFQDASARTVVVVDTAAPGPRGLAVAPAQASLPLGGAVALQATATDTDGGSRDSTWDVAWASSRPDVAAFADGGPPGFLEATGPGDTVVTARWGTVVAQAQLHVAPSATAPAAFPLSISPSGRFLVDAHGVPFRLQGEGAWSLLANLTAGEVDRYLQDRQQKGFNALLVNLLEHKFAASAPSNRAGQPPLLTPGDFATPNGDYFLAAARLVEKARAHGFLVLLVPAYLGGGCPSRPSPENEGWSAEMEAAPPAACLAYGRYVGSRFRDFDNVVWVQGGDCLPTPGGPLEACALQVLEGLRQAGATQLQTGHWSPSTTSLDEAAFAPALQLDAVYQYRTPAPACRRATARTPPRPTFLIESGYENEAIQGSTPPAGSPCTGRPSPAPPACFPATCPCGALAKAGRLPWTPPAPRTSPAWQRFSGACRGKRCFRRAFWACASL